MMLVPSPPITLHELAAYLSNDSIRPFKQAVTMLYHGNERLS